LRVGSVKSSRWPVRSQGTTDPEEATSGCRSPSARRASDKMTIGVTYEGALGKLITARAISGCS
jgi:hypothetical protein